MLQRAAGGRRGEPDRRRHPLGPGASEQNRLVPLLDEVKETFGVMPERALADAGYRDEAELSRLEERGVDACVALRSRPVPEPLACPATVRMAEKLATPEGKARYARRKWLSEAPNGWIKEAMGFRRFSVRGLAKARGEWNLVCLALNVKRMGRLTGRQRGIPGGIPFLEGPEEGPWARFPAPCPHLSGETRRPARCRRNPRRRSPRLPARELPRRSLLATARAHSSQAFAAT